MWAPWGKGDGEAGEWRQKVTPVLTSGLPAGFWGPGKDSGAGEREALGKEASDLDSSTLLCPPRDACISWALGVAVQILQGAWGGSGMACPLDPLWPNTLWLRACALNTEYSLSHVRLCNPTEPPAFL